MCSCETEPRVSWRFISFGSRTLAHVLQLVQSVEIVKRFLLILWLCYIQLFFPYSIKWSTRVICQIKLLIDSEVCFCLFNWKKIILKTTQEKWRKRNFWIHQQILMAEPSFGTSDLVQNVGDYVFVSCFSSRYWCLA